MELCFDGRNADKLEHGHENLGYVFYGWGVWDVCASGDCYGDWGGVAGEKNVGEDGLENEVDTSGSGLGDLYRCLRFKFGGSEGAGGEG